MESFNADILLNMRQQEALFALVVFAVLYM